VRLRAPLSAPVLSALCCAALLFAADNPRKEIVQELPSAALGEHGVILCGGPAVVYTQRYGDDFSGDPTGGFKKVRGVTTRGFGAGVDGSYDIADGLGRNHLLPGASFQVFPSQKTFYDDGNRELIDNTHSQFCLRLYYGRSSDRFRDVRHMFAAGPVMNLFLWYLPDYGMLQRLAGGFGADYYFIKPLNKRQSFILAASYRLTTYKSIYWYDSIEMQEYHHTLMLSAGMGF
jgi:hypothetical protein